MKNRRAVSRGRYERSELRTIRTNPCRSVSPKHVARFEKLSSWITSLRNNPAERCTEAVSLESLWGSKEPSGPASRVQRSYD